MAGEDQRPVVIMGAGRHGRNVADILRGMGRAILGFLDDTKPAGSHVDGIAVLGGFALAEGRDLLQRAGIHVALGNPLIRKELSEAIAARGGAPCSAIHPSAAISPSAELGAGLYIAPFVRLASGCRIGDGCILEAGSVVGGASELGAHVFLGAHCSLVGGSRIGTGAFLGTQASVLGVSVGARAIIGAGSVVTRDLPDDVRAFGTPARIDGPADWSRPPV